MSLNLAKVVDSHFHEGSTDEIKRKVALECANLTEPAPIHCRYFVPGKDKARICQYQGNPTYRDAFDGEDKRRIRVYWCHKNPNFQN